MSAVAGFIVGFIMGILCVWEVALYIAERTLKNKKAKVKSAEKLLDKINKLTDGLDKRSSVDERLTRVKEIINEQFNLQYQTEGPQKSAMDGKHKNMNIRTVKSLEDEKNEILRSIITDGYDPTVSVAGYDGKITDMKLSEFMVQSGVDMEPVEDKTKGAKPKPSPSKAAVATKTGKFVVHRGGKNDNEGTSH